jgi:hypothetical protein
MALLEVMRALHASEIHSGMASQRCVDFRVWLGDERSGIRAVRQFAPDKFDEAATWLADEARKHFPESEFARGTVAMHAPRQRNLTLIWGGNH